jgi:hypothetical protein
MFTPKYSLIDMAMKKSLFDVKVHIASAIIFTVMLERDHLKNETTISCIEYIACVRRFQLYFCDEFHILPSSDITIVVTM